MINFLPFGLATALLFSSSVSNTVRVSVFHKGAPINTTMVGINKEMKEVPIKAFPAQLAASRNGTNVSITTTPDVYAVCAKSDATGNANVKHIMSCVALDKETGNSNDKSIDVGVDPTIEGLRRALSGKR